MKHFLIYHSENVLGKKVGPEAMAYTKKNLGIACGDRIWLVAGHAKLHPKDVMRFTLAKTFVVDHIKIDSSLPFPNRYHGKSAQMIDEDLTGLLWFEDFKRQVLRPAHYSSQKLTDLTVVGELEKLLHGAS